MQFFTVSFVAGHCESKVGGPLVGDNMVDWAESRADV